MNERHDLHQEVCSDVENLLIRATYEEISDHETEMVQKHCQSCPACRSFRSTLTAIPVLASTACGAAPKPAPIIKSHVHHRMHEIHHGPSGWFRQGLHHVTSFRPPVYQTLIGIAAIMLITFIGINDSISIDRMYETKPTGTVLVDTTGSQFQIIQPESDTRDSLQNRRTVQEDSLFSLKRL